jgi:hypothetical protein
VFVNYSGRPSLRPFHGKAIALDIKDRHAPFPCLFIIHEMRVRGFHPFEPVAPDLPSDIQWQDWILSDNVLGTSGSFNRQSPPDDAGPTQPLPQIPPMPLIAGGTPSGRHTLALNEDVIAEILAATRALPSWKACEMEGTSWIGTAEENIQKYVSSIGVQGG